jgi:structural maintenance of chromosome 1
LHACVSKEEAGMKTAKLKDEKEVYDRQLHADEEALKNMNENIEQLRDRVEEISSHEDELRAKLEKTHNNISKHRKDLDDQKREIMKIADERRSTEYVHYLIAPSRLNSILLMLFIQIYI